MNQAFIGLIQVLIVIFCTFSVVVAQQDKKCDFSKYKPLRIDHFLPAGLIEGIEPKYPAAGKAMRVQGKVRIKILVDRNGTVIKACPIEGHPLLISTSMYAAYRSRFKHNFGFSKTSFKGKRFIADELIYNFVVPQS